MITKKSVQQIDIGALGEPALSAEDWREFEGGWRLFNERKFWHAHELWESVWKRRPEESRIFFQGIIQLAAAYHLLVEKRRFGGMMRNFEKAEGKLRLFPPVFLRVDVRKLLQAIADARSEANARGEKHLAEFNTSLIPVVSLKPL